MGRNQAQKKKRSLKRLPHLHHHQCIKKTLKRKSFMSTNSAEPPQFQQSAPHALSWKPGSSSTALSSRALTTTPSSDLKEVCCLLLSWTVRKSATPTLSSNSWPPNSKKRTPQQT